MANLFPKGSVRVHAVGSTPDRSLVSVPLAGIMGSMPRNAPNPVRAAGPQELPAAARLSVVVTFRPEVA